MDWNGGIRTEGQEQGQEQRQRQRQGDRDKGTGTLVGVEIRKRLGTKGQG